MSRQFDSSGRHPRSPSQRLTPELPYDVGYRRPPLHTQFKPGQSGYPKGRQKGRKNLSALLDEELNRRISVREGDRVRTITKREAWILGIVNGALKNDPKAFNALITLQRILGVIPDQVNEKSDAPLTDTDRAILANFLQRATEAREQKGNDAGGEPLNAPGLKPKGTAR